jgi:hypothetical protein
MTLSGRREVGKVKSQPSTNSCVSSIFDLISHMACLCDPSSILSFRAVRVEESDLNVDSQIPDGRLQLIRRGKILEDFAQYQLFESTLRARFSNGQRFTRF